MKYLAGILMVVIAVAWLAAFWVTHLHGHAHSNRDALCAAYRAGEITQPPRDCPKVSNEAQEKDVERRLATAVAKAKEAR